MLGKDGNLRPHWDAFFQSFNQLGNGEMNNRNTEIQRLLKENGVTYNIYGDNAGLNRDWNVDAIPFLISKEEWEKAEAAKLEEQKKAMAARMAPALGRRASLIGSGC